MSNRYNYFDDEDETKPSNHKIDLSQALNKIKSIEENVHDEAEDDIEVLEKFPLLRQRVIKIAFIVVIVLFAVIMAVSFSVSLHTKEKRAEKFRTDAGNVCINYIKDYGSIKWEALDENEYGENKAKLTGLCYVRQMDFNSDGKDELFITLKFGDIKTAIFLDFIKMKLTAVKKQAKAIGFRFTIRAKNTI